MSTSRISSKGTMELIKSFSVKQRDRQSHLSHRFREILVVKYFMILTNFKSNWATRNVLSRFSLSLIAYKTFSLHSSAHRPWQSFEVTRVVYRCQFLISRQIIHNNNKMQQPTVIIQRKYREFSQYLISETSLRHKPSPFITWKFALYLKVCFYLLISINYTFFGL